MGHLSKLAKLERAKSVSGPNHRTLSVEWTPKEWTVSVEALYRNERMNACLVSFPARSFMNVVPLYLFPLALIPGPLQVLCGGVT